MVDATEIELVTLPYGGEPLGSASPALPQSGNSLSFRPCIVSPILKIDSSGRVHGTVRPEPVGSVRSRAQSIRHGSDCGTSCLRSLEDAERNLHLLHVLKALRRSGYVLTHIRQATLQVSKLVMASAIPLC
jgi:hypothetical protein